MSDFHEIQLQNHLTNYENEIYRIVEGQHYISTRPLVDSDEEHDILEAILDASKPPAPIENSRGTIHYLLYTPFRYKPPLKFDGRFHTRMEQSIFYGSEELKTAMAEVAYGRMLFMIHTRADLKPMQVPYTHFVAKVRSKAALALTKEPFAQYRTELSHPSSYGQSQSLGKKMRASGIELFTYFSARNHEGVNVGLFSVEAFKQNTPIKGKEEHWSVFIGPEVVEFKRPHLSDNMKESHRFHVKDFCVGGIFPVAA